MRLGLGEANRIRESVGGFETFTFDIVRNTRCVAWDERGLMRAWRYAVIAFLAEALKKKVLKPALFGKDLMNIFEIEHKREWHVFITREMSKAHFLQYAGRYIRRPPVARHRLKIFIGFRRGI